MNPSNLRRGAAALVLFACISPPADAISIADHPALARFVDSLVQRDGFDRSALKRVFAAVSLQPQVIDAIEQPREALPWHAYRRGFLTKKRIRLGARYWRRHRAALERARRVYGVPPELVVAIIGMETRYGTQQGSHVVLDALVTLMLDYSRRADFFRNELEEFLLLTRELHLDPRTVKGSYAGALGIPQFVPSSYRRYAVDFDGDRQRDLFRDSDDAIGSVANFLSLHGWDAGQPVIDPVRLKTPHPRWPKQLETAPILTVHQWHDRGVVPVRNRASGAHAKRNDERPAALIALEGESGPIYHLGYNNFYVITRYNRSDNYAMAVYELARKIRARYRRQR